MDLVSCRNLLIYLEGAAQDRVLSLAHFALREGGYLFLGNSETIGTRDHQFSTVSKRWRIYRRVGPARSSAIDFSAWPSRDARAGQPPAGLNLADIAVRSLAERYAPAAVVIDRSYRIHHFHGVTDDYLTQPAGAPTLDLLSLARNGLRMTVRRVVQKAIDEGKAATLTAGRGGRDGEVAVTADPLPTRGDIESLFLVTFASKGDGAARTRRTAKSPARDSGNDFEEELKAARDELRGTTEQFETANEELKAANEEITSVNEELQATNEELEASKEELQSLNEELNAVNSQLERKVAELEEAGDDLRNLLAGSEIATIFLDKRMRIKWFTPAVQTLFDLLESDVGRPIANFTQKFAEVGLVAKAEAAMETLKSFEEDVRADDGRCFSLRVKPTAPATTASRERWRASST
jgi:Methylase of chemotaxis methyl-accepting proteins